MRRIAALLPLLLACSETVTPAADAGPVAPDAPTWHQDVAPIIAEHCQRCHLEGGIGPFALTEYEQAKALAGGIAASTASRRMPPFLADNSGDCNTWRDANWLSDEKIAVLDAWAAAGAPEGEPVDAPVPPTLPTIDNPELTVTMEAPFEPNAELADEYRCFVLDPELDSDTYVTAYEVMPGDERVVHHVILYAPNDADAEAEAEALDGEDEKAGYSCYGGSRVDADMIVAWAPGTGATSFPEGSGLQLKAGRKLIMQVHYNMVGGSFPDQSSIKLRTADRVANPGRMSIVGVPGLEIPPGVEGHVESGEVDLRDLPVSINLWGILPHMHELGTSIGLSLERGDQSQCLIDVPRWDFNWQLGYFLEEPVRIEPGDRVKTTCTFDSRSRDEVTTFGDGTQDEMCLAIVFVTMAL